MLLLFSFSGLAQLIAIAPQTPILEALQKLGERSEIKIWRRLISFIVRQPPSFPIPVAAAQVLSPSVPLM